MKKNRLLECAAIAVWLGAAGTALAGDAKVHNAAMCSTLNEDGAASIGGAVAASSNTWVSCPIVRDNAGNTGGLDDLDVFINDASTSQSTYCLAYSLTKWGAVDDSVMRTSEGTGHQRLDFGSSLNVSSSMGTYYLACWLRPNDILYSYRSTEP